MSFPSSIPKGYAGKCTSEKVNNLDPMTPRSSLPRLICRLPSPRRWGQGHTGATNLILRRPGLVTRILPIEIARAMGIDRSHGVSDCALQSIAGNAVTNVMADSVAKRTIQVCKIISDSVQLPGSCSASDGWSSYCTGLFVLEKRPGIRSPPAVECGESGSQDVRKPSARQTRSPRSLVIVLVIRCVLLRNTMVFASSQTASSMRLSEKQLLSRGTDNARHPQNV